MRAPLQHLRVDKPLKGDRTCRIRLISSSELPVRDTNTGRPGLLFTSLTLRRGPSCHRQPLAALRPEWLPLGIESRSFSRPTPTHPPTDAPPGSSGMAVTLARSGLNREHAQLRLEIVRTVRFGGSELAGAQTQRRRQQRAGQPCGDRIARAAPQSYEEGHRPGARIRATGRHRKCVQPNPVELANKATWAGQ